MICYLALVFNILVIMRKINRPNLTLASPYRLRYARLDDQITCLNLVYSGQTLKVSRSWYKKVVEKGYLDSIDFNLVIVNNKFNPSIPDL